MGSDYFIGVVLPKMAASGSHPFLLCSALRCVPAGEASTFGKAMAAGAANTTVSAATHYIVEVEVTEVVTEEEWFTTSLHAEMADAALLGVPQPFLIERFADESRGGRDNRFWFGKKLFGFDKKRKEDLILRVSVYNPVLQAAR